MKPTVRQRIFRYVARLPGSTASEISRNLDLSTATVRHHLAILRSDGRISQTGYRRSGTRGRPTAVFRLSDRLSGDNLSTIAECLLEAWPARPRSRDQERLVQVLTQALALQIGQPSGQAPLSKRLGPLVDRLSAAHYQARWEAGAEGPRIVFGHCPYAAIVDRHPILCEMDARLLSEQLRGEAHQIAKIDLRGGTVPNCVFVVK